MDAILDALPNMVFVKLASDLSYLRMNEAARDALGIKEASVAGSNDLAFFPGADGVRIQAHDRMVVDSGVPFEIVEESFKTVRGTRWFATEKVPVMAADGLPGLLVTISSDITDRKELPAMWEQVFRYAEGGIVIGSPDSKVLELMNPAFAMMLGYTMQDLAGKPLLSIFAPGVRQYIPAMFHLVQKHGHHTFETLCLRADGTTFPVLVNATSVRDARGNVRHRAIRIQDTSLLKSNERVLRTERRNAERANEAKSDFLSRMSHELRTPLNVILGFAQVLKLDDLNEGQTEGVKHILDAGRHLLALIDETLDISRIEAGQMALSLESVNVGEAIEEVLQLMQPLANNSGIRFVRPAEDIGRYVLADKQRLKQVLLNLVANGINYNVRGGDVTLGCRSNGPMIEVTVADTGVGFPEGSTDRLFAPFDRLGQESGTIEGSGLGLSLSKALVETMGGTLSAAANAAVGSTFTVTLKASERPESSGDGSLATGTTGATGLVLYIEDNLANFRLVEHVLARRPGVRVVPAMQGGIGLLLATDHRPDLIILDLNLPDMSGEEILRRLLQNPETKGIPVVVATANASRRRLDQLVKLGARACLTKPIDILELLETIDSLLPNPDAD